MSKVARVVLLFAAVCMMAGCANLRLDDGRDGFVSLAEAVPDAILEIRYYSTYNFVGERIDGGVPDAEYATEQDLPRLEALMFDVSGSKIYGQILVPSPKAGRGRPCAIICHGIAGFTRWDDVAHDLCRAGIAVVIPHHRGAWGSDGEYLVSGCITDAEELAKFAMGSEFAQSHGTDTNKVYLIGHSMGGNSVLNAASRLPGVRGVALIAPCEIGYMAQTMSRDGVMAFMVEQGMGVLRRRSDDAVVDDVLSHADGMRFTNAARNIAGKKVFLATGDYDDVVPSAPLDEFWASLPSDGELHWRKSYKASHAFMGVRREIASDLTRFIYARLQGQTWLPQ